jgi:hypothetical protein
VRRSFSVEAKRCENVAKTFSLRSEKNLFFRLFRFEAKLLKIKAKRKRTKRKKTHRNETQPKNCGNKSQKAKNLIDLTVLANGQTPPPPHPFIRVG